MMDKYINNLSSDFSPKLQFSFLLFASGPPDRSLMISLAISQLLNPSFVFYHLVLNIEEAFEAIIWFFAVLD